jgi:transcriptional regulator with XRE-family HTH domain
MQDVGLDGNLDDERRRLLSAFLTEHRYRIDPATPVLGEHPRPIDAIGTLVTPSEIADAAGINRRWYERAERGEPTRTSAEVLRSLGDVLRLSYKERKLLLRLAPPCLDRDTPRDESMEMRDAFASLRRYLRKLYECSARDDVLHLVQDTAAALFPEVSYLTMGSRLPDGGWMHHREPTGNGRRLRAFVSFQENVLDPIFAWDPLGADVLTCFPGLSAPGDIVTYDDHDETRTEAVLGKAFNHFKQLHECSVAGVIRSRTGFVAHLLLGGFLMSYDNEVDRALVSSLVDFASAAVSP